MDNKKKFAAICIGVLILSASVGTTLAYLGATDKADNKIKVGTDVAKVEESDWSEPEIQKKENTNDKTITVKNTGSVPCFVRVYAEFSDSYIASIAKVANKDTPSDSDYITWAVFKNSLNISSPPVSGKWVFIPESENATTYDTKLQGYFYYTEALPVYKAASGSDPEQGVTTPLIKSVKVNYDTDNIDEYRDYEMIVYTETVQTVDTNTGYDYGKSNEWEKAWKAFLKIPITT